MIKNKLVLLITCTLMIACGDSKENPMVSTTANSKEFTKLSTSNNSARKLKEALKPAAELKKNLLNNNVRVTGGVNIKTGEPTLFDSLTGKQISPCSKASFTITTTDGIKQDKDKISQNNNSDCNVTIVDPKKRLRTVIESTKFVMEGTIKKNGINQSAKFITSVTALYKGSDCMTEFRNGQQYQELCVTKDNNCQSIYKWDQLFAEMYPEVVCPECTPEELALEVIMQLNKYHPECVDVIPTP